MQKELSNDDTVAGEVVLKMPNVAIALVPDIFRDELLRNLLLRQQLGMDAYHQRFFVVAAVENADPPALRETFQATPKIVMIEVFCRWALE